MNARAILDRLVGFPTVSRDSNLELVSWVEEYLSGYGVTACRVYDETGKKAALYANVGPEVEGGVVLSGHTDVVPVDGQDWSTDPFTVTEKGGKLYGRGTCDMKGFDALALAMVPYALERGVTRPLQIALSYDEEIGCVGAPPMIDDMVQHLPRAAAAVIGEPTMLRPVTGHNASVMFKIHVKGYEVHSSKLPEGVSAVHEAGRILHWVNQINDRIQGQEPDPISALFDPPFTTCHVGMIEGGTAHNITAKDCHLNVGFRCPAGDNPESYASEIMAFLDELHVNLRARHPNAGIEYDRNFGVPGLAPEPEGRAESLIRQLTGDNGTHVVTYGTEAGQFQERGYSAVVCGPGDIAQAHQPDEWIAVDQFVKGEALLRRVVDTLV